MSAVNVRHMFFTGDVQRSISSIAPGSTTRSATSASHWSRCRSSCSVPPDKVCRVVSSPPMRISKVSMTISSSDIRCPSTSELTRMENRSSVGSARRLAMRPMVNSVYAVNAFITAWNSSRLGSMCELRPAHQVVRPLQQHAALLGQHTEHVADHRHRQRGGDVADEVALTALADRVDQRVAQRVDGRLLVLHALAGEPGVDQLAPQQVCGIVHVDHVRHARLVGTNAAGAGEHLADCARRRSSPGRWSPRPARCDPGTPADSPASSGRLRGLWGRRRRTCRPPGRCSRSCPGRSSHVLGLHFLLVHCQRITVTAMAVSQHTVAGTVLTMPVRVRRGGCPHRDVLGRRRRGAATHRLQRSAGVPAPARPRRGQPDARSLHRRRPGPVSRIRHSRDGQPDPGSDARGLRALGAAAAFIHHLPVDQAFTSGGRAQHLGISEDHG